MRKNLPVEQLGDLLDRPFIAALATYRRDGAVLLSPVWHEWRDGGFQVSTWDDDLKVRHVRRDPRASIVVYDHAPPYRGVELRGLARILPDAGHAALRRIARRYLGRAAGDAYADGSPPSVLIRLEPGELRTWDLADDFPAAAPG